MRISFFIGSLRRGGAERVISRLASHFFAEGWDVDIVLLLSNDIGYKLESGITIVEMCGKGRNYAENILYWLYQIRHHIKKRDPDRIVSFVGRINALVLLASLGLNKAVIASERNDPRHDGRSKTMLRICDALYSKAAVVVFQSEYQRSCFSASAARHSRVIPNPVAVNAAPAPREVNRIVTVGRLSEQKNQKMLIEAAHILKDTFPDLTFELYGAGKNHDELAQMIAALDLAGSVKLMGNRENVHQCINSAAMFVLTSRYEGVSNALLEAMMLGLPCICTEFPGVDEVIRDGCNGLLVPQNDAQALADAIQKLLENKELCDELSKNAIDSVQRFRADRVMTEWEDAIVQLQ